MDNLKAAYAAMNEQSANEAITRSPQINELIALVTDIRTGKAEPEELKNTLEELKEMMLVLSIGAEALKATQPASDNFEEKFARLMELFELLTEEFNNMELYIEERDDKYLDEPLENIKSYIAEVLEISDDFKKAEDAQPVYSQSIVINDMIRIGYGFVEGQYEELNFKPRYETALESFEETYIAMQSMENAPKDTKAFEEGYPKIMELLEDMKVGFDGIGEFFEAEVQEETQNIKPYLDKIKDSSHELYMIQLKIAEEIEQLEEEMSKRVCPRCGNRTPTTEKYCHSCSAVLPLLPEGYIEQQNKISVIEGGLSGFSLPGGEGAEIPPGHKLVSPNVLKIYEASFKVGNGEITHEEFAGILDWYEKLLIKTRNDMAAIKEPPNLDENGKMIFNETFNLLIEGVDGSQEGLNELKLYLEDENTEHLIDGVNAIMEAGEKLYGVQAMGEVAQRRAAELQAQEQEEEE